MSSAPYANYGDAFRGYDQQSTPHSRRVSGATPAPYMNTSQQSTFNGVKNTTSYHVPMQPAMPDGPPQQPQMNPEQTLRQKNMGLIARGPSPYSTMAVQQRAATPVMGGTDTGAGGKQAPLYKAGTIEWKRLEGSLTNLMKTPLEAGDPGYEEWKTEVDQHRKWLYGDHDANTVPSGMGAPFHPMSNGSAPGATGAPTATPRPTMPGESAPGVPLPPSDKYVRRGPNLAPEAPLDPGERQRRLQLAYGTAAKSLDDNPGLGTTGIPAPKTQFTYSDTAAHKAVEMGPDQQKRNEGAMLRGAERERQAGVDKNAAQFAQNQQAAQNIGKRSLNFERGDYDLSHAPGQPQPAGGAVAGAQPSQQQGLSNFHVNPQTGERIGWDGSQWRKAQ